MTESESKPQEDDIDGEAMDLDGEAIPTANAENLDGQPIDEDLDGAPMT